MKYKNFFEIHSDLRSIISLLNDILKDSGYSDYNEISVEASDAQERFIKSELSEIFYNLDVATRLFKYLDRPVIDEGFLYKNSSGRYQLNDYEFTCGSSVEVYHPAPDPDYPEDELWISCCFEHDGNDYYLTNLHKDFNINGCRARRR